MTMPTCTKGSPISTSWRAAPAGSPPAAISRTGSRGGCRITPSPRAVLLPGEFNGQPIRDATLFDVRPGDWVAIPPNVAHAPGFEPNEYLMYAILKVNVGLYPQNAMY